jgi:hypothetical protein
MIFVGTWSCRLCLLQLIACALDALVHGDGFCSVDGNTTLLHRVAALHVVDHMNLSQIWWFSQLVSLSPGVMVHLNTSDVSNRDEMVSVKVSCMCFILCHCRMSRFSIQLLLSKLSMAWSHP